MKAIKLKLGTHMEGGLLYRVDKNQVQGPVTRVTSLDRFYNLLLMNFVVLFSRTVRVTKLKPDTHMDSGLIYRVPGSVPRSHNSWK